MALGASKGDVVRLVVREGVRLSLLGMAFGVVAALALARVVSRLLYGLSPAGMPVFVAVAALLGAIAWLACYVPARRATSVDPIGALRCE